MSQSTDFLYENSRAPRYDIASIGFRYHLANLHAAIGLAQLARLDEIVETRRRACRRYNDRLGQLAEVRVPRDDFAEIVPFLYHVRVPPKHRDPLRVHLELHGIETGIHWRPGHSFTLLREFRRGDLSVTERVGDEIISLPLHSRMPLELVDRVADGVVDFFKTYDRS